jgi:hypothetical protein
MTGELFQAPSEPLPLVASRSFIFCVYLMPTRSNVSPSSALLVFTILPLISSLWLMIGRGTCNALRRKSLHSHMIPACIAPTLSVKGLLSFQSKFCSHRGTKLLHSDKLPGPQPHIRYHVLPRCGEI